MKIGILGGTFDPVHLGHLRTAEEIGHRLGLEKVYLVLSSSPPNKPNDPIADFRHRLAMVRMAVGRAPLLDALDLEGRRPGFSYSIETLQELTRMFSPEPELFFILGTDAFLEIETWKEYRRLFDYAHFVIIQRAGYETEELEPFLRNVRDDIRKTGEPDSYVTSSGKSIRIMVSTFLEISSTGLREMVKNGDSIRFLVPETVREYIMKKGLYTDYAAT
ncbi:MAG: nicotinate (nicotinamide) nucleotide adenylyltransferase [Deltaproteobacteria bacterium]|nr:nicotinate (nicotinamide) nucleotide adenylyltransferase [Deltaproteobacteria bacterium]